MLTVTELSASPRAERLSLRSNAWHALALCMLAVIVHLHALTNGFAYDDVTLVLGDDRAHSLRAAAGYFTSGYWRDPDLGLYRPLASLSFALNYAVHGVNPWGYHAVNLLLHACVTVLVFTLLLRYVPRAAAVAGAAVFAVHPVHVEAVANVAGRAELLAGVFALAACVLWQRREADTAIVRFGVPILFLCGLLAKESVIALPGLLLLLDAAEGRLARADFGGYARRRLAAAAGIVAATAAYAGLRFNALPAFAPTRLDPSLAVAGSAWERTLTALQAWPEFARLLLFPATLLADYGPGVIDTAHGVTVSAAAGALLLMGCIVAGIAFFMTGWRLAGASLLWFVLAIAPVSSLILPIGVLVAERTLYVPSVAVALAVGAAVARLRGRGPAASRAVLIATAAVVVLLAVRSAIRVPVWASTEAVFAAQLRDRPDSFRAQWMEAKRLRLTGDSAAAIHAYARALHIYPYAPQLGLEAVTYAMEVNALRPATDLARAILAVRPRDLDMHRILAGIAIDIGDFPAARAIVERGLVINPGDDLLERMRSAIEAEGLP